MKLNLELAGRIAFIAGLIISVVAGFLNIGGIGILILVVLGVVVGFLNVTGAEVSRFLLATVALMLVGTVVNTAITNANVAEDLGSMINNILSTFTAFIAGAALIVALKEVFTITKSS